MPSPCPSIILRLDSGGDCGDAPPFTLKQELAKRGVICSSALWQPLRGGRTNRLWRVTSISARHVVKLYDQDAATPLFANDPIAEASVLTALTGSGRSPEVVFSGNTQAGPVLVYHHLSGTPWRKDSALAGSLLRSLHATPVPQRAQSLPRAPDGSHALKKQTLAVLDQIPSTEAAQLRVLEPDSNAPPSGKVSLLHGDPVPDNIIVCAKGTSSGTAALIDWQCPMLGDPLLDLSVFLSPAMQIITRGLPLSSEERHRFIKAYDDSPTEQRLQALQPILHWRMAAYCLWKMTRPTPDSTYAQAMEAEISALKIHASS